jgi:XTP/dITP diphosphohydrolase
MEYIYLLTRNEGKVKAANLIFGMYGIEVKSLGLDIPEIQASTSIEIAKAAALEAHRQTGKAVIREDHSFYITELGFPGPFMAYADKSISPEKLLAIVNTLDSRDAYFELAAAYVAVDGSVHEFSYKVPVIISTEIRGSDKYRWEKLMMMPGDSRTFAEVDSNDRTSVWSKNYDSIAKLIRSGRLRVKD